MRRTTNLMNVLGLFAALGAVSCAAGSEKPAPMPTCPKEALVLRSYDVHPGYASELTDSVNRLMSMGNNQERLGRAHLGPGGKVLVAAPQGVQDGVTQLLQSISGSTPTLPPTISITYWVVTGRPGDSQELPADLREIDKALSALAAVEGGLDFSLEEKLELRSLSGEKGHIRGRSMHVEQWASARGDEVVASIEIELWQGRGQIETRLALPVGKLLVLGRAGVQTRVDEADERDVRVFYVVRAVKGVA